jgi:hypothetical protein
MDIPASFPDQATSAATKNNNPGNIKMPSSDGPVAVALRTLGISYEQ